MKNKIFVQKLNLLKKISVFGKSNTKFGEGVGIVMSGYGKNAVSFFPMSNVRIFKENVDFLYNSEIKISDSFSHKIFQKKLIGLLKKIHSEDRDFKEKDWDEFKTDLYNLPEESFRIFAPIYGITMDKATFSLGDFTIYNPKYFKDQLVVEYPKIVKLINEHVKFDDNYKISVDVVAKDMEKCYELGFKAFNSFENVANFTMATFHKTKRVGIFNYSKFINFECFMLNAKMVNRSSVILEHFEEVKIDDFKLISTENDNDIIWKLITSNKNQIEQRILNSIEWCGKALIEVDDSKALLQYIIAIESLLQYDEGKFIVPSIVSQSCDTIAFLLGETYKDRIYYSTEMKKLYQIRSSITHSGKGKITSLTLHTAHVFCYKIIKKLIGTEPFNKFQNKDELYDYLHNLKYGQS